MSVSVADLKKIADNGGAMILDAKKISSNDLKAIASNANIGQAKVTLKNPSALSSDDLKTIASNSKGSVIFDFYDE